MKGILQNLTLTLFLVSTPNMPEGLMQNIRNEPAKNLSYIIELN